MKTSFLSKFFFCTLFSFCLSSHASAQWAPQTNSTSTPIYRDGSVGIGLSANPSAVLHVFQDESFVLLGSPPPPPSFRLEKRSVCLGDPVIYAWDFIPNDGLQILQSNGNTSSLAMNIKSYGLEVTGANLYLGYGAGTSTNDNMTIGYSNTISGNFIAFNGTYGDGLWQGQNGKAVIHSNIDGSLYFVTQDQGGYIPVGQNRRLTISPDGTSIFGDDESRQTLSISSSDESILRFNRDGQREDYELLDNQEGDLEFRGGINGEGPDLPTLMKLKSTGKLAIGTDDTPNAIGGDDISAYTLYVEQSYH